MIKLFGPERPITLQGGSLGISTKAKQSSLSFSNGIHLLTKASKELFNSPRKVMVFNPAEDIHGALFPLPFLLLSPTCPTPSHP